MKTRLILLIQLVIALSASAQYAFNEIEVNNVRMRMNSIGLLAHDPNFSSTGMFVPSDSDLSTLFAGNLWVGGVDANSQIHLAADLYTEPSSHDWYPGPLTTDGTATTNSETMAAYDQVWVANSEDINLHRQYFDLLASGGNVTEVFPNGYSVPSWFYTWPAHGDASVGQSYYLAPFYDYNGDGMYIPDQGDYPLFCGDKCLYAIFNDNGGVHANSGGNAIGLEVHAMLFSYENTSSNPSETFYLKYKIINRGSLTLNNTFIGHWMDFDIGNNNDDRIATDVTHNAMVAYNGDDLDEANSISPGYGTDLPMQSVMLLAGPRQDFDGLDNPVYSSTIMGDSLGGIGVGYGDGIVDNERIGMTHTMYYYNSTNAISGMPTMATDYYNYLRAYWKDGSPLQYGWPNSLEGVTSAYVFPSDSDPSHFGTDGIVQPAWTEESANVPSGDRRMLGSSGPFTFMPQTFNDVELAFVFARESEDANATVKQTLEAKMNQARLFDGEYANDCMNRALAASIAEVMMPDFGIYPNPSNGQFSLALPNWDSSYSYSIVDSNGRLLNQGKLNAGIHEISDSNLSAGVYMIQVKSAKYFKCQKVVVR